jgi:glycosyltransferase involved in cell wall biosynthesis
MKSSLVICTRNRASRLGRCLEFLEVLDLENAEIVFVNNGSEDETGEILRAWTEGRPDVRVVDEPRQGLGRARNTGWKSSRGEIVVFTDDDCYATPSYVQEHIRLYDADPSLGWISGRILLYDPNDAKITIQENTEPTRYPPYRFLEAGAVHGANMSFRRSALEAIGGFDPLMGVGSHFICEDLDAAARACFRGFAGLYSPNPVIQHHHGRQTRLQVDSVARQYRIGRGNYYGKCLWNPSMRRSYLRAILGKWLRMPLREVMREAKAIWDWRTLSWSIERSKQGGQP